MCDILSAGLSPCVLCHQVSRGITRKVTIPSCGITSLSILTSRQKTFTFWMEMHPIYRQSVTHLRRKSKQLEESNSSLEVKTRRISGLQALAGRAAFPPPATSFIVRRAHFQWICGESHPILHRPGLLCLLVFQCTSVLGVSTQ